jgi:hypothetical protein
MRARLLEKLRLARRDRREREGAEPLLDDAEKRQDLLKRIAAGISANKFPPR